MSALASTYTDEIHDHFKTLYGNWQPGESIQLGDVGVLDGALFRRTSNLAGKFVKFGVRAGIRLHDYSFKSTGSVDVRFTAKAALPAGGVARAGMEISFARENAVFLYAAGCKGSSVEDQDALGKEIWQLYNSGNWDVDACIVTGIVEAERYTTVVSGTRTSKIEIEADSDVVPRVNLADVGLGLTTRSSQGLAFEAVGATGGVVLISLMGIVSTLPFGLKHGWGPRLALTAVGGSVERAVVPTPKANRKKGAAAVPGQDLRFGYVI